MTTSHSSAGVRLLAVARRGGDRAALDALPAASVAALERLLATVSRMLAEGSTRVEEAPTAGAERTSGDAQTADADREVESRGSVAFDAAEQLADAAARDLAHLKAGEARALRLVARIAEDSLESSPSTSAFVLRGPHGRRSLATARSVDDEHRLARALLDRARSAVPDRLRLVTGGPGTGKTRTIARLVAERVSNAGTHAPPSVVVMAPTGRAAARLREQLAVELRDAGAGTVESVTVSTIHAALRWRPRPGAMFMHTREHPLAVDLAVVDECSMVDLALMRRLVEATPPAASLVLVGDADQLASVEAGSVFADLCAAPALDPVRTRLSHNFRTRGDPRGAWLASLVGAVLEGDGDRVVAELRAANAFVDPPTGLTDAAVEIAAAEYGRDIDRNDGDPVGAWNAMRRFRVLAATHVGDGGVESISARLDERLIRGASSLSRQIMILENDREAEVANGDLGVVTEHGVVVGCRADGSARCLRERALPAHESAWAISIHKSQGSEFDRVLVVLPPDPRSPVLSRQLLYTALTRSRGAVTVVARERSLRHAVATPIRRHGGLADAMASR